MPWLKERLRYIFARWISAKNVGHGSREQRIQKCEELSEVTKPRGLIFKRCPHCNKILEKTINYIDHGHPIGNYVDYELGFYCYYYSCSDCGYRYGILKREG